MPDHPPRIIEIPLGCCAEHKAVLVVMRDGQRPPREGDEVQVRWLLGLPGRRVNSARSELADHLIYATRLSILSESLGWQWGNAAGDMESAPHDGYRYRSGSIYGTSWRALFDLAEDEARRALQPLLDAIAQRNAVLARADEDPEPESAGTVETAPRVKRRIRTLEVAA